MEAERETTLKEAQPRNDAPQPKHSTYLRSVRRTLAERKAFAYSVGRRQCVRRSELRKERESRSSCAEQGLFAPRANHQEPFHAEAYISNPIARMLVACISHILPTPALPGVMALSL